METRKTSKKKKFPQGPIRTCVICRQKGLQLDLRRFSLAVVNDDTKRKGRGAYVCPEHDSGQIDKNIKKLAKALRCDVEALHIHLKGESRS